MADANNYLNNVLTDFKSYVISDEEKKIIDRGLKSFITQKLFLKKFRKQKLIQSTIDDITNRVDLSIKRNEPIHFIIFFGGYKHFWNSSAPEPDWAEVFTFKFLSEWVAPVIASYKPGVLIEIVSEDWILERMNNYKAEDLETYCKTFSSLVDNFNKNLPENLRFKFVRLGDRVDKAKMLKEVESKIPEGYERWNSLSEEDKEYELKRSSRSVILKDGEGIDRIIESRVIELAYYEVEDEAEFSGDYFTVDNNIYLSFSFGLSKDNIYNWIVLGSTYASTVDFWVGRGILEESENGFVNRIVSRDQYKKIKDYLRVEEVNFDEFYFKNLKNIEIIKSEDWNEKCGNK